MKLNDLQKMLPDKFIRVHQSYLVNLDEIEHVENGYLILKEGRIIKISKKYIDWVRQMIS
jgi:DNA-binding LytR/AlgR family response regulator